MRTSLRSLHLHGASKPAGTIELFWGPVEDERVYCACMRPLLCSLCALLETQDVHKLTSSNRRGSIEVYHR